MVKSIKELPTYDELPNKTRYWEWGPPGSHEEALGKQNLLTAEHVAKSAQSEIKTGERVGLGWELHKLEYPAFGRIPFQMTLVSKKYSLDDVYNLNPQQSSQWDGFRHHQQPLFYSNEPADLEEFAKNSEVDGVWYGGTTREELLEKGSTRIGIHHWAQKGIVGRGVLLDYAAYADEKGIKYSVFESNKISYQDLQNVIKRFDVKIEPGDILFIRIGLNREWDSYSVEEKKAIQARSSQKFMGLEPSEDIKRFIWDSHFPAVASDAICLEVFPETPYPNGLPIHHHLLAGWGVTIGEIFDLEPLSALCRKLNRYSFFVSSVPLNSVGGVASPPNAVAIF